jgi:hypothetical protein
MSGNNLDKARKQYNGSDSYYWLRPAYYGKNVHFTGVTYYGNWNYFSASNTVGVAPAFRIG